MGKNKLILTKPELVEIITSTVSTIQEQKTLETAGDLYDTLGNFGGFFNWQWADKLHSGEDY